MTFDEFVHLIACIKAQRWCPVIVQVKKNMESLLMTSSAHGREGREREVFLCQGNLWWLNTIGQGRKAQLLYPLEDGCQG